MNSDDFEKKLNEYRNLSSDSETSDEEGNKKSGTEDNSREFEGDIDSDYEKEHKGHENDYEKPPEFQNTTIGYRMAPMVIPEITTLNRKTKNNEEKSLDAVPGWKKSEVSQKQSESPPYNRRKVVENRPNIPQRSDSPNKSQAKCFPTPVYKVEPNEKNTAIAKPPPPKSAKPKLSLKTDLNSIAAKLRKSSPIEQPSSVLMPTHKLPNFRETNNKLVLPSPTQPLSQPKFEQTDNTKIALKISQNPKIRQNPKPPQSLKPQQTQKFPHQFPKPTQKFPQLPKIPEPLKIAQIPISNVKKPDTLNLENGDQIEMTDLYYTILNESYFFPIDKLATKKFLLDGMFLIRPSTKRAMLKPLTVCLREESVIKYFNINVLADGSYSFTLNDDTEEKFESVPKMMEYYSHYPYIIDGNEYLFSYLAPKPPNFNFN